MKILSMRIIEGPNIFSYNHVLRIKINIAEYEHYATNQLAGFTEALLNLLPGLSNHSCSRGYPGGFVERLKAGTYMAHVFEHAAIELQNMAGYAVGFGKTRFSGTEGIYDVVIGYRHSAAAKIAAEQALIFLKAVLHNKTVDVSECIRLIKEAGELENLGPSTQAIYDAAAKRNIPITRFENENFLFLGYGCRQQRIWATLTGRTSVLASDLACDKHLTKQLLSENGISVPFGKVVTSVEEAVSAWKSIGSPVAIKPLNGNQGKGVILNSNSQAEVERAFNIAAEYSSEVVVEEYITGRQYRLCVVDGNLVAAAERIPAHIIGDGKHTIKELVELINMDPLRGEGHGKPLSKIKLDAVALTALSRQKLTPDDVVGSGRCIYLRESANLSTGGTAVDVTDIVHISNRRLVERAARIIGLDVAGVDIVCKDITKSLYKDGGAVIEINAAPGIRMHHFPSVGKSRNVAQAIVDYLFKEDNGRIPITAITGTNGKTTVARMIANIWQCAGYKVGMTTTDGIYINTQCILTGDTTGPKSAKMVLTDPTVEVAVLETARGGILRGGLAFDSCDIGIVTNITEDHLGQDGIEDLEDLAYIKSLVVEVIHPGGYAILNADDKYVTQLSERVKAEIVYFSVEPDNMIVKRHLGAGGKAFFVKDKIIYAASGKTAQPIIKVSDIPVTIGGIALHNVQNAVIAAASCYCYKIPTVKIREGLSTFENNPGRLHILDMGHFRVCVDYGHNPAGYKALIHTVSRMGAKRLVGVIGAPGDRRDDVVVNIGKIAGRGFNQIYIKEDADLRGRISGEVAKLLLKGVRETSKSKKIKVILSERQAVESALEEAQNGDLVVIFYEKYNEIMEVIKKYIAMNRAKVEQTAQKAKIQVLYKNIPG